MSKRFDAEKRQHKQQLIRFLRNYLLLIAAIVTFLMTLSGCASSSSTPVVVPCPQPPEIAPALARSDLPDAQAFSEKVSNFFQRVREFANGSQSERTQSETSESSSAK